MHFTHRPFLRIRHEKLTEQGIGGIALAVSILAGSTFNGFAKSLRSTMSALSLLFVSEILTSLFVLLSFGFFPVVKSIRHIPHHKLMWLALMASLSGIMAPLLWFTGLSYTSAVNAGFFGKAEVIFLLMLAHFVLKERITQAHFVAIGSVLAGMIIISLQGFTTGLSLQIGDLLIIIAAFCYGAGNIIFRSKLHGEVLPHVALISRSTLAVTVFFLASPFISHPFISEIGALPTTLFASLIGFAFISRFLNSVSFYVAIERLPVSTISIVTGLDLIGSTAFSYLYLGEPVLWFHWIGGAFILMGNLLLEALGTHKNELQQEEHLKQRMAA